MTVTAVLGRDVEAAPSLDTAAGFEVNDREFESVLGRYARLVLVTDTDAHEGPVYYVPAEDALYFTTVPQAPSGPAPGTPRAVIRRLALEGPSLPVDPSRLSTLRVPVHMPNGMSVGNYGRLVVCEQGTCSEPARISQVDPRTGRVESIVDNWGGLRLNSPNDVVVRRDGTIWFTDPCYGYLQGFRPEPQVGDYVYRFDPRSGRLSVVRSARTSGLAGRRSGPTRWSRGRTPRTSTTAPGRCWPRRHRAAPVDRAGVLQLVPDHRDGPGAGR
jgi:gluconolactonase